MPLRVYNTLSQTKEPFQTVHPGKVGMYVCGPTVYSPSHIGHMVGPGHLRHDQALPRLSRLRGDLGRQHHRRRRQADRAGPEGRHHRPGAGRAGHPRLSRLPGKRSGVDGIDHMPRATEHIGEIIAITQALIDKGFAYASSGDVYFDVARAADYGKLSHRDPEELLAGARIEPSALKRHPGDFACGRAPSPASRRGTAPGDRAGPAGTSSARP